MTLTYVFLREAAAPVLLPPCPRAASGGLTWKADLEIPYVFFYLH